MSDYEPRPVLNGLLLIAVLGVVVSTWIVTAAAGFTFEFDGTGPTALRQKGLSAAIGFALLSFAALATRQVGAARWLVALSAATGLVCALASVRYFASSPTGPDSLYGNPWWWVIRTWVVIPTTWPIVIVFVASLFVRGRPICRGRRQPIK